MAIASLKRWRRQSEKSANSSSKRPKSPEYSAAFNSLLYKKASGATPAARISATAASALAKASAPRKQPMSAV